MQYGLFVIGEVRAGRLGDEIESKEVSRGDLERGDRKADGGRDFYFYLFYRCGQVTCFGVDGVR